MTKTDADIREGEAGGKQGEKETMRGDPSATETTSGTRAGTADRDRRTRARGYGRGMADSAVAYMRHYVPRDRLASRASES